MQRVLGIAWAVFCFGCATGGTPDAGPVRFSAAPAPHSGERFPNWPAPPDHLEPLIESAPVEVRGLEGAGAGTTGAMRVTLYFPEVDEAIELKWKETSRSMDGINNAPRKEIAAWDLQKFFLDPEDYVVPLHAARCVPLERYRASVKDAKPTIKGSNCVFGVLAIWLQDVTVLSVLLDEERIRVDATHAYFMSNLNLLTYLLDHQDGRSGNFLVSTDPDRRQVFSIDNGVAMNRWPFYNWFVPNWNVIRVPALRRDSIERLRALDRSDLDSLSTLAEFRLADGGIYQPAPLGEPLDPDKGVRIENGVVQLGLTRPEIDRIWERIEDLLEQADAGEISLF